MITSPAFAAKAYGVFGLARTGLSVVASLKASGAHVLAWDDKESARAEAQHLGADIVDLNTAPLEALDALVMSPGVPINRHALAARARAQGVPIIGDVELFAQARAHLPAHKLVGITGTNGKSTTTALIHHIAHLAGPAMLGGNIGLPVLSQEALPAGGIYVLELSSFQIDLTHSLDCDVAVLTNITPDHLDRYRDFEDYAAAKARLFAMQSPDHIAVIATEDAPSRAIAQSLSQKCIAVSSRSVMAEQAAWPTLQGPHNAQNAACAIAVAQALGISDEVIAQGLKSYPGLPHRMERVATIGDVLYVNDSKATNATSSAPALGAYPAIHWILGGRAKTDELDACKPFYGHVRRAYVIGEAADMFAALLSRDNIAVEQCGTLEAAVRAAARAARAGEVVLLSPACASYDQFSDYEARGRAFVAAVEGLKA